MILNLRIILARGKSKAQYKRVNARSRTDNLTLTCHVSFRENEGDLTQTYDKNPLYQQKIRKLMDMTKTPPKRQRLRTDLGRSVGVTTVIQLLWFNWFTVPNLQDQIHKALQCPSTITLVPRSIV